MSGEAKAKASKPRPMLVVRPRGREFIVLRAAADSPIRPDDHRFGTSTTDRRGLLMRMASLGWLAPVGTPDAQGLATEYRLTTEGREALGRCDG